MRYFDGFPVPALILEISKPALRNPDIAARVVCGNQLNFLLMLAMSDPASLLSNLISWDFLVSFEGFDVGRLLRLAVVPRDFLGRIFVVVLVIVISWFFRQDLLTLLLRRTRKSGRRRPRLIERASVQTVPLCSDTKSSDLCGVFRATFLRLFPEPDLGHLPGKCLVRAQIDHSGWPSEGSAFWI